MSRHNSPSDDAELNWHRLPHKVGGIADARGPPTRMSWKDEIRHLNAIVAGQMSFGPRQRDEMEEAKVTTMSGMADTETSEHPQSLPSCTDHGASAFLSSGTRQSQRTTPGQEVISSLKSDLSVDICSTLSSGKAAKSDPSETAQQLSPATPPMSDHSSPLLRSWARPTPTRHPPGDEPDGNFDGHDTAFRTIQSEDIQDQSRQWKEVRRLRELVWGLRSTIHELRADLKIKQDAKAVADDMLFRRMVMSNLGLEVENSGPPGHSHKALEELMKDCQDARDIYGPLESECTSLEDQLSRHEFRLTELETPFFLHEEEPGQIQSALEGEEEEVRPSHCGSSSSIDEEFAEPEYHPLVSKYLSTLADLDLLTERRDELMDEQLSLEEKKETRLRFNMALDPDDQVWLDDSYSQRDALTKEIESLEKEIDALREGCRARGLVDEDGEPTNFQAMEESSFHEEDGINPIEQTSEHDHKSNQ
ncbi:hypothetical protein DL98DRAFT_514788 [Cadophora sp. DSE1049]|nr:hypothetical protein DL98DRAFT_514788 [Cadophora sp. DSE1049]